MSRQLEAFDFLFTAPERRRSLRIRRWLVSSTVVAVSLILLFSAYHNTAATPDVSLLSDSNTHLNTSTEEIKPSTDYSSYLELDRLMTQIYKPFLYPIDAETFTGTNDVVYKIAQHPPRFTQPLRNKVLILDVDTRALDGSGGMMNEQLDYDDMSTHTAGMLSHYLYAMIHGYDYKFIQSPMYTERHQTWVKVPMIREALRTYEYVVFMDADAAFHYHHLPLEWLFNHWNITSQTMIAMALDPDIENNLDDRGLVNLNSGFIIAQASDRTIELFNTWENCVADEQYPGCSKWRYLWSHEQAAFSNYLRYEYEGSNAVISLPCNEANGYPAKADLNCTGEFVRHYWQDKGLSKIALQRAIAQYTTLRLHDHFHKNKKHNLVNGTYTTLPLPVGETVVI